MSQRGLQRRVSQKLAYARWHLDWCGKLADRAQQRDALLESAVWHSIAAYRCFLAEMAADQHMQADRPVAAPVDARSLSECYTDYLPAALAECANLEASPGWLQDLLRWTDYVLRLADEPALSDPMPLAPTGLPDPAALAAALDALEQLIERLRGDMLEY